MTRLHNDTNVQTAEPRRVGNPIIWDFLRMPCRILCSRLLDLKVYGAGHVPARGGALLISNHQSHLDPIVLGVQVPRRLSFIAKTELFDNALFGWLLRSLNTFPVRRGETDVGAIREALRRLHEGRILTMFPEGTRSRDGRLGPIQPGIAMLIRRAAVPVIPAVIQGTREAWPPGARLPRRYPVRVMYGPPLPLEGLKGARIVELIDRTLRAMVVELQHRAAADWPRTVRHRWDNAGGPQA